MFQFRYITDYMTLFDLQITVENVRGSYKKFSEGYPVPGVTFPTHYGFMQGYKSEDGHDLDVFLGDGDLHGYIKMKRPSFPDGVETKMCVFVSQGELVAINEAYAPVMIEVKLLNEDEFLQTIEQYHVKSDNKECDIPYVNLLSPDHESLIHFYTNVVGLNPIDAAADAKLEKWYGFETGHTTFAIEPLSNRDKYDFEYKKGNPILIQLKANNLEHLTKWTERLELHGVVVGQRVLEKSYGTVTTFVDPDGNVIELLLEKK